MVLDIEEWIFSDKPIHAILYNCNTMHEEFLCLSPAAEEGLQLRRVTRLRSIKFFVFTDYFLWDMCNNIQVGVEFTPWAIKNIQDGCRKMGQIYDKRCSFLVESMKLHILGF